MHALYVELMSATKKGALWDCVELSKLIILFPMVEELSVISEPGRRIAVGGVPGIVDDTSLDDVLASLPLRRLRCGGSIASKALARYIRTAAPPGVESLFLRDWHMLSRSTDIQDTSTIISGLSASLKNIRLGVRLYLEGKLFATSLHYQVNDGLCSAREFTGTMHVA